MAAAVWKRSRYEHKKTTLFWTLEDFPDKHFLQDDDTIIKSPSFKIPDLNDDGNCAAIQLLLSLTGTEGVLKLDIKLTEKNPQTDTTVMPTDFAVGLFTKEGEVENFGGQEDWKKVNKHLFQLGEDVGSWYLLPVTELLENAYSLLPNDRMTVVLELQYHNYVPSLGQHHVNTVREVKVMLARPEEEVAYDLFDPGDRHLSDFEIKCDDWSFFCHKVILARGSKYFDTMLKHTDMKEAKENYHVIEGMTSETLSNVIRYIYTKKLKPKDADFELHQAADRLHLIELKDRCAFFMTNFKDCERN